MITRQQVIDRCYELVAKGNALHNTNVRIGRIEWFSKGKAAGYAGVKDGVFYLRFSSEALVQYPNDTFDDTVPHEVAHLIQFEMLLTRRTRDRGHGATWKRIARSLGCSGERTHTLKLTPARISREFEYVLDSGRSVKLKCNLHKKIQMGQARTMRSTNETIASHHYKGEVR